MTKYNGVLLECRINVTLYQMSFKQSVLMPSFLNFFCKHHCSKGIFFSSTYYNLFRFFPQFKFWFNFKLGNFRQCSPIYPNNHLNKKINSMARQPMMSQGLQCKFRLSRPRALGAQILVGFHLWNVVLLGLDENEFKKITMHIVLSVFKNKFNLAIKKYVVLY